ncbi:DUF1351 domain-containing protein [Companilactobacillus allii]|uniref:DUF1351 domain-containing protein n=1 Tax=Companilactobacillus allii TaxID=1847728 RepID=A0A1P8Q4A4_9LACO|nr:DUF1351 domain-containing protein [Companilactobacillus allii]APX72692.1 hypothetical protein BTM29_09075 [Companilactobacillus allii]USQ69798.1 DUF1351 domain-containing protein [Companilactobacillus allii]
MANELANIDFGVSYTPTEIKINNEEGLKNELKSISLKYKGLIVTEDNLKGVKSTRAKLNALNKGLDDKRKEIKASYNEPLSAFEDRVKDFKGIIDQSLVPIDNGIKKLENSQREGRKNHVQDIIDEMAPEYDIDPNDIEFEKSWTNKTMTDIKLTKIFADGFNALKRKKELIATNKKLVEEHCKYVGVEAAGWVSQLSDEYNATDVIKAIDQFAEDRKLKEIAEKKRLESEKAIKAATQRQVNDVVIDDETGELIESKPQMFEWSMHLTGSKGDLISAYNALSELKGIHVQTIDGLSEVEGEL